MVYYDGEYHMFWQHNPYGWNWGNMTWGHTVSKDMVHWKELGDAIHPDHLGTIFSGSAVVDEKNTAGWQTGDEKVIVCAYTSAGGTNFWSRGEPFTQSIAYSNDRGRTWTVYENNPVLGHINGSNRDPKVIWHEPTGRWVMVLYLDGRRMGFFSSSDLKSWTKHSELKCFHECPELFELPVDGDKGNTRWILYGGSGDYLIGDFDGKEFKPEGKAIRFQHGNCFYASQTFNNMPKDDGRRIQMAWGRIATPGMPFNQCILFPVELTLQTTDEGIRMFAEPVREIENIHGSKHTWEKLTVRPGERQLSRLSGELFHIKGRAVIRIKAHEAFRNLPAITISAWVSPKELSGYREIFRKEDGDRRILFSFQDNGRILSLGLNVEGSGYDELDARVQPALLTNLQWHHAAGSRKCFDDKANEVFPVDGNLVYTRKQMIHHLRALSCCLRLRRTY